MRDHSNEIQLRERVKELQCLYRVAELFQRRDCDLAGYLEALPDLLPEGWFYPEITAARVVYRGQSFQTANFRQTPWSLTAPLLGGEHEVGSLQVVYLEERPESDEGAFLSEERALINALATHVGKALLNKDLEEHLKRSQRLEALGFVASGVAHDLNNFLSVIRMSAEFALANTDRGENCRAELHDILQVVDRSFRMANRLVSFASRSDCRPERVDLNLTLKECQTMLDRLLGEKAELRLDLEPGLEPVEIDVVQLDQLLANLAVNARDAMPGGGVVTVATRRAPGGEVALSFKDAGVGMKPEVAARIFEPFFSTKGRGGAGLGLATVEEIVRTAGAQIAVRSQLGQGTCFEVLFPSSARPEPSAAPSAQASPGGLVLLVDDEETLRYLGERLLRSLGYETLVASTGEDALVLAASYSGEIDLLLTDLTMADLNGRQLSERLRELRPGLRTLLMSGYSPEYSEEIAPGLPLLPKPFHRESLRLKIEEVLSAP